MSPAPEAGWSVWLILWGKFSLVIGQLGLTLGLVIQDLFSLIGFSIVAAKIPGSNPEIPLEPKIAKSDCPFHSRSDEVELYRERVDCIIACGKDEAIRRGGGFEVSHSSQTAAGEELLPGI